MDRTERFYKIDLLLQSRRATPLSALIEELDVSRATIKRDLEYLRDRLNAPIVWNRSLRGYQYEATADDEDRYALPGLWFNAGEAHALLTMDALLSQLQPGLLGPHIEPLRARIRALMETSDHSASEVVKRIRILNMATRSFESKHFEVIASALLSRKCLLITHYNRRSGEHHERLVSPQRLIHYRGNWYLDAWCHLRDGLRSFAIDAIEHADSTDRKARHIAEKKLDDVFASSYGIFSGKQKHRAILRFTPQSARWVANEQWHPEQKGRYDEQGHYLLEIPYANDTELVMDILRHGPDCEVVAPDGLRNKVLDRLNEAVNYYTR
ncbi:MAG TPA: transcriptional regulator [Gammaproteobacteria bacterium]|nr:transcriptional regulator [Gammaproteobacteria bacterium]